MIERTTTALATLVTLVLILAAPTAGAREEPTGWTAAEATDTDVADDVRGDSAQLSDSDQARYDRVALSLVESINARDAERYRALFTDTGWSASIEWWRDMFQAQIDGFGKIATAYAPRRGLVKVGQVAAGVDQRTQQGATFLVRFEEPAGGVLTFLLDTDDRIVSTDVFVSRDLGLSAPEGGRRIYPPSGD